jgi:integrase/recombinase XerD
MTYTAAHLAHLTLAGYSGRTIGARKDVLRRFHAELGRDLLTADRYDLATWLGRDLAPESRRAYRSHLVGFYRWCVDEGLLEMSPADRIPAIKVPRRLPRPIAADELSIALRHADARMRAWLTLMAYGGLRCMEVAALRPRDIEPGPPVLLWLRVTKGGGDAVVPAHPAILEALAELPIRAGCWWDVAPQTVSKLVGLHLKGCGIDASAHRLRHYAGTAWYRASGNDLLVTAQLLRHASVGTTQGYAAISPERAAEVVRSLPTVA